MNLSRALRIVARALIGDAAAGELMGEDTSGVLLASEDVTGEGAARAEHRDDEALLTLEAL